MVNLQRLKAFSVQRALANLEKRPAVKTPLYRSSRACPSLADEKLREAAAAQNSALCFELLSLQHKQECPRVLGLILGSRPTKPRKSASMPRGHPCTCTCTFCRGLEVWRCPLLQSTKKSKSNVVTADLHQGRLSGWRPR